MKLSKKKELSQKRRWRIRKKINGTAERPRVCVRFSNKNIHAQCVDDEKSHTVVGIATTHADFKEILPNVAGAEKKLAFPLLFSIDLEGSTMDALKRLRILFEKKG